MEKGGIVQQKNEINYWNGKYATLKRDLEYQERYAQKYKEECEQRDELIASLEAQLKAKESELQLQRKQLSGMQEDNDRINRMY